MSATRFARSSGDSRTNGHLRGDSRQRYRKGPPAEEERTTIHSERNSVSDLFSKHACVIPSFSSTSRCASRYPSRELTHLRSRIVFSRKTDSIRRAGNAKETAYDGEIRRRSATLGGRAASLDSARDRLHRSTIRLIAAVAREHGWLDRQTPKPEIEEVSRVLLACRTAYLKGA